MKCQYHFTKLFYTSYALWSRRITAFYSVKVMRIIAPVKTINRKDLLGADEIALREQEAKRHSTLAAMQAEDRRKKQELAQKRLEDEAKRVAEAELAKEKAAKQVRDTAVDLLDIYSRRAARKGFACSANEQDYLKFSGDFAFEETADQQAAIDAVRKDLLSAQPMDRLVCGDVGFGKTEIAIRAAFKAVDNGKQVAILVPTTILAFQHYNSFIKRFKDFPVNIEFISSYQFISDQSLVI